MFLGALAGVTFVAVVSAYADPFTDLNSRRSSQYQEFYRELRKLPNGSDASAVNGLKKRIVEPANQQYNRDMGALVNNRVRATNARQRGLSQVLQDARKAESTGKKGAPGNAVAPSGAVQNGQPPVHKPAPALDGKGLEDTVDF